MERQTRKVSPMRGPGGRGMGSTAKAKNFKKSFIQLGKSLKSFKWMIVVAIVFAIASTALNIISPTIIKNLGKVIIVGGKNIDMSRVMHYGIVLICMYVGSGILNFLQGFIMAKVTAVVTKQYRTDISKKNQSSSSQVFRQQSNRRHFKPCDKRCRHAWAKLGKQFEQCHLKRDDDYRCCHNDVCKQLAFDACCICNYANLNRTCISYCKVLTEAFRQATG